MHSQVYLLQCRSPPLIALFNSVIQFEYANSVNQLESGKLLQIGRPTPLRLLKVQDNPDEGLGA